MCGITLREHVQVSDYDDHELEVEKLEKKLSKLRYALGKANKQQKENDALITELRSTNNRIESELHRANEKGKEMGERVQGAELATLKAEFKQMHAWWRKNR